MELLKVKAFLYYFLTYIPIGVIGIIAIFIGNLLITDSNKSFFTPIVGVNMLIFGTALFIVSLAEPFLKLIYQSEAINSPFSIEKIDVSTHQGEKPVGIKISPEYDMREIGNKIIKNECDILGRPYCLKIARKSGLTIDDLGKIQSSGESTFSDIEKLVKEFVRVFGKPALYASEIAFADYPDLKFKPLYKSS